MEGSGSNRGRSSHDLIVSADGKVERVAREPVARVVADAATRPINLLAGAGVAAGAIVLGLPTAVVGGVVGAVYGLFVVASVVERRTKRAAAGSFRLREALLRLPPTLRARVSNVIAVADAVRDDLDDLPHEPEAVRDGLDQLTVALIETARRAAEVDDYLGGIDCDTLTNRVEAARLRAERDPATEATAAALAEQLAVVERLAGRRDQLDAQMEQIAASLGVIQARVVQARIESDAPLEIQGELLALRDRTRALAESFGEVQQIGETVDSG